MYPFERFSEKGKRVLTLAQEEAERSQHSYIGTEHILLGLLRVEDGLAASVLAALGVELPKVREAIERVLGANERIIIRGIIPTSRVKKVVEYSFDVAREMGDTYVGTEHLLLGLMIEGEGVAAHVLEDLGVAFDRVRDEVGRQKRTERTPDRAALEAATAALPLPLLEALDPKTAQAIFTRHALVQLSTSGPESVTYSLLASLQLAVDTADPDQWEAAHAAGKPVTDVGNAAFFDVAGRQLRLRFQVGDTRLVVECARASGTRELLIETAQHVVARLRDAAA